MINWLINAYRTIGGGTWVALFANGKELTGGGYERVRVYPVGSRKRPAWRQRIRFDGTAVTDNLGDIEFPVAYEAWPRINGIALFDAPTGGTMVVKQCGQEIDGLVAPLVIGEGDRLRFMSENLRWNLE